MTKSFINPVILCGGSGTRLWPLSRKSFPKQYLSFMSRNNKSLLQETYERISKIENIMNPILVCNEEHRFIAAEQMREINIHPNSILLEPFGRNTGPAITLASLIAIQNSEDPILLILSSDHEIKKHNKFMYSKTVLNEEPLECLLSKGFLFARDTNFYHQKCFFSLIRSVKRESIVKASFFEKSV